MSNLDSKTIPTKRLETLVLIFFVILTFQYVSFYYVSENILPRFVLYLMYGIAIALPALLLKNLRIKLSSYRLAILMVYFIMVILSFFYLGDDLGSDFSMFIIYLPILTGLFFYRFSGGFLHKAFKYISIVALAILPFILIYNTVNIGAALKRDYTYTPLFFFAPLFWAVIPAVILAVLKGKNILLSFAYWMGAIVLNLIFLKRFILVDSGLILIVIVIINATKTIKAFSTWKILSILVLLIAGILYLKGDFISKLFDATTNRIETTSQDISAFDRWVESENYFREASPMEIILGKGFTGTQYGLGTKHYALHVGWTNFILKGGILLFILILFPFLKLVPMTSHLKSYPIEVQFSYWFLIIYIVRLTYVNMHNFSPEMLIFFYAVYNIMASPIRPLKGKRINSIS